MTERQKRIERWREVGRDAILDSRELLKAGIITQRQFNLCVKKAMIWLDAANELEMEPAS